MLEDFRKAFHNQTGPDVGKQLLSTEEYYFATEMIHLQLFGWSGTYQGPGKGGAGEALVASGQDKEWHFALCLVFIRSQKGSACF